jgi:hypothetical protein
MFRIYCKKEPYVFCLEISSEVYSGCADRLSSVVNKKLQSRRKIFVDETLLQIDGQKYNGCG